MAGTPRTDAPVAVCIPVYQGGRHLADTLRSVLTQTLTDVEVVVLDNASTDTTAAVLAWLDDPRLTVWRNVATVPMVENVNRVIELANAPLVKLLSADNLLEPNCLATQVEALQADPGRALVVGRNHFIDDTGRILFRSRGVRQLLGDHDRTAVARRVVRHGANPIGAEPAATFRRSAFVAAGCIGGTSHAFVDLDLWMRILLHGTFHGQPATVGRFRVTPGSVTSSASATDYRAMRAFIADIASEPDVRRVDRLVGKVGAPLAGIRRQLVYAIARVRARRLQVGAGHASGVNHDDAHPRVEGSGALPFARNRQAGEVRSK